MADVTMGIKSLQLTALDGFRQAIEQRTQKTFCHTVPGVVWGVNLLGTVVEQVQATALLCP